MGFLAGNNNMNGVFGGITGAAGAYFTGQGAGAAYDMQYGAMADKAVYESESIASRYELGGLEALINASLRAGEYEIKGLQYEIEADKLRGDSSLYKSRAEYSDAAAEYALRNADALKRAGHEAVEAGASAEGRLRQEGRAFRGEQTAAMAASGAAVDSGTALDILRQTDEGVERDSAMLRVNAAKERYAAMVQEQEQWVKAAFARGDAANYRTAAQGLERSAGLIGAGKGLMEGAAGMARTFGNTENAAYQDIAGIVRAAGRSQSGALRSIGSALSSGAKKAGLFQALGKLGSVASENFIASSSANGNGGSSVNFTEDYADYAVREMQKKQFNTIFSYPDFTSRRITG